MKLLLATFLVCVAAVPLSKAKAKSKAACCIVDPTTGLEIPDPDDCRCFGAYKPAAEHQQCMTAAPQFTHDRLKTAWQAGCWCIDETKTCQDWCDSKNTDSIRVLAVNPDSGENEWLMTTVKDQVEQPVDITDTETRTQCFSGCVSRGFCSEKLLRAWEALPDAPKCDPLPTLTMADYAGDALCKANGVLGYNQHCNILPKADFWCKTNTVSCIAEDLEARTLQLHTAFDKDPATLFVEATTCFPITYDPTQAPSPRPSAEPTANPTAEPTAEPTAQPIANPTFQGCMKYNNLPQSCSEENTTTKCSYMASTTECQTCSFWAGNKADCDASSMCGLMTATNECSYCPELGNTDCAATTGCTWTGLACQ